MTESLKKTNHLVRVYLSKNIFFVVGAVEMPPIFVWREVNLALKAEINNKKGLAQAIETARLQSMSRFHPGHGNPEIKPWNGEAQEIRNSASASWSIWWNADDSIDIDMLKPGRMYKKAVEWKKITDTKKTFISPVSSRDIAQEILSQIQTR